jgi:hypothetical protein
MKLYLPLDPGVKFHVHFNIKLKLRAISSFCRGVDQIFALLEYNAALSGSSVQTFSDNPPVPFSMVKKCKKKTFLFKGLYPLSAGQLHSLQ